MMTWQEMSREQRVAFIRSHPEKTAAEMAALLGRGVTRDMILGAAWRAGIKVGGGKKVRDPSAPKPPRVRNRKPRVAIVPPPPLVPTIAHDPVHILQVREGQCRYPMWEETGRRPKYETLFFCAAPTEGASSYCLTCRNKTLDLAAMQRSDRKAGDARMNRSFRDA